MAERVRVSNAGVFAALAEPASLRPAVRQASCCSSSSEYSVASLNKHFKDITMKYVMGFPQLSVLQPNFFYAIHAYRN